MPHNSQPELWRDLFVMFGGAAASLIGLLFVVMSLYFNAIREGPNYNLAATIHAARNNTYHLLTVFVTSVLALTPQPPFALGVELVGLHLFGLRLPALFTYQHYIKNHGNFPIAMVATISSGYSLGAIGGVGLILHAGWALFLVTASCTLLVVRTVLTAWMLMFERRQHEVANSKMNAARAG